MATRSNGVFLMLALVSIVMTIVPSPSISKPRPPLSTRQADTDQKVVVRLRRLEIRSGATVPSSCGLSPDSDLAILHYVVRNHGKRPYTGHVNLFSLLTPTTTASGEPGFWGEFHPKAGACGAIPNKRYPIDIGFDPPLAKKRAQRFYALFEVPRQTTVARVIYHDDDRPTCLSAPRAVYRPRSNRLKRRAKVDIPCDFFIR